MEFNRRYQAFSLKQRWLGNGGYPLRFSPLQTVGVAAALAEHIQRSEAVEHTPGSSFVGLSRRSKARLQQWSAQAVGRFLAEPAEERTTILCYHSVHPSHSFSLRPEIFEAHLSYVPSGPKIL